MIAKEKETRGINGLHPLVKLMFFLVLLYFFLVSVELMGASFKFFGKGFAKTLITTTAHPLISLFIGILVTSIIQSPSATTSMVVAFVAAGTIPIQNAVPIIMGANIGTSVTNILVSFTQISYTNEFKRAFSAAVVHDFFNVIMVLIFLPLELTTHFLYKSATIMANFFSGTSSVEFHSPIKMIVKTVVKAIEHFFDGLFNNHVLDGTLMLIFAVLVLFMTLSYIVKIMKGLMGSKTEVVFNNLIKKSGLLGILIGTIFTMIIQSSSMTTSLLVPLAGAGIASIEAIFPITLGANIGTTVTAILASLATNKLGLTIAFVHLLFNFIGVLLIYPIPAIRNIPITLAKKFGEIVATNKKLAILYVLFLFYVLPWVLVLIF